MESYRRSAPHRKLELQPAYRMLPEDRHKSPNRMQDSSVLDGIGWKFSGNVVTSEAKKRKPFFPRFHNMVDMIPMVLRATAYTANQWMQQKEVFINVFSQMRHDPYTGVPIGGIGCGSIGTDFRGGFNRFALRPGVKEQRVRNIKANQFILTVHDATNTKLLYHSLLTTADFKSSTLSDWKSTIKGSNTRYRGLFPRAWREIRIPEIGLTLICEQVSPVIPHNYEETSFPVCNFHWTLINNSSNKYNVSMTFTFRNGTGSPRWEREGKCIAEILQSPSAKGLKLMHSMKSMPLTFAIATEEIPDAKITYATFNPTSTSGEEIWDSLKATGSLSTGVSPSPSEELGIAVSSRFALEASSSQNCRFCLAWVMPIVQFGARTRSYKRYYTRYIGDDDEAIEKLVTRAITEGEKWRTDVDKWQSAIINDGTLPEWYRSALLNELYYVVDGGSMWFEYDSAWKDPDHISDLTEKQMRRFGRFGYMESWEYLMVNTYDVHFYSSWAFVKNWPDLELSIQLDFCDQIDRTNAGLVTSLKEGRKMETKIATRIPHDMGNPHEEPWAMINAYILHDTADWRDLNLKFVILCWRDYKVMIKKSLREEAAQKILRYFYKESEAIVRNAMIQWDPDGNGMIENSGTADQTYDVWTMSGTSAYCGSLWLGALSALINMAEELEQTGSAKYFEDVLDRGRIVFLKKLWNGKYFNFDEYSSHGNVIMADQLCGLWYLGLLKEDKVISEEQITSALRTIYANNVKKFADGNMGPVNGMYDDGSVDLSSIQSEEVWTGTAYSLASFMIIKGLRAEGFETARGMFETCWNRLGLQYQTPEAIYQEKYYRAIGYMRPLAVWAMQHAVEVRSSEKRT